MKKRKHSRSRGVVPALGPFVPVCDAVAALFQPYVEVVLHDLATETVAHIANNFSNRALGEPSLMHEIDFEPTDHVIGPYEKINWDDRRIKSISVVLRAAGAPVGVMCINTDVSHVHAALQFLGALVALPETLDRSTALFKEDWHERINEYISCWMRERGTTVAAIDKSQKRDLIVDLARDGALGGRNAAGYIARVLGLSRATVYNYLRETK